MAMDREEIVELLESLSDTLSEMGTSIAEDDLGDLKKTLKEVRSDLGTVEEYLDQHSEDDEGTEADD